jgi:hypothetical protein
MGATREWAEKEGCMVKRFTTTAVIVDSEELSHVVSTIMVPFCCTKAP